jgi:hypothetical protein
MEGVFVEQHLQMIFSLFSSLQIDQPEQHEDVFEFELLHQEMHLKNSFVIFSFNKIKYAVEIPVTFPSIRSSGRLSHSNPFC